MSRGFALVYWRSFARRLYGGIVRGKECRPLEGVILLGSYSTADLCATELRVLSVYGSNDGVMNREKYAKYKPNLPTDTVEQVIEGGTHAYFGAYGEQDGDGTAEISQADQLSQAAALIAEFIK